MLQIILYNQLNTQYLYEECTGFVYFHIPWSVPSPYGALELNPHSVRLEKTCSQRFVEELCAAWNTAERHEAPSFLTGIQQLLKTSHIVVMAPAEYTLLQTFQRLQTILQKRNITLEIRPNTQFLIDHQTFVQQFPTPPVMDVFYRRMRKKTGLLMDGAKPLWWTWNYDKENRKFDKKHTGKSDRLIYPETRTEALQQLQEFIAHKLDRFWELEDAIYAQDMLVHHSGISTALNFWLLTPQEVLQAIEQADTAINNKEWYIRQILWRREYMYHWFWYYKDTIYTQNALKHTRDLPKRFRWPDKSPLRMFCVNHVLQTVKNTWYSHHITRLMIIWNFCLLMWYNPHDVNKRFWEMYTDAFERVVTPNVLWMSQYADGWKLATKPYISSANYINNMSDYCSQCRYDPKQKSWPRACPMNYLYRNFVDKHRDLFKRQPYVVNTLDKLDIEQIRAEAQDFIDTLGDAKTPQKN